MPPSGPIPPTPERPEQPLWQPTVPSWLISLVLHFTLVIVLSLTPWLSRPESPAAERTAEVGIVLKRQRGGEDFYQGKDDARRSDSAASAVTTVGSLAELFSDRPPSDPTPDLPPLLGPIGGAGMPGGGVGSAIGKTEGPGGQGGDLGGRFRTQVFGVEGEGYKLAYVFDRSGSMGWHNALAVAKDQLLASLESLEKTHQFQIVFFNEEPSIPQIGGTPGQLLFATDQNKILARKFVGSIIPAGNTDREKALSLALKLQPDVIFFLTDADDPMWPEQLETIRRLSNGISINAIEFGSGPAPRSENFLVRLARETGGKYGYVDISKFPSAPRP